MLQLPKEQFPKGFKFNITNPEEFNFPFECYVFIGLISLIDPIKSSVPYAINKCKTAGIKVIMITEDQLHTASAIAKQLGIITMKTNEDLKEEGMEVK